MYDEVDYLKGETTTVDTRDRVHVEQRSEQNTVLEALFIHTLQNTIYLQSLYIVLPAQGRVFGALITITALNRRERLSSRLH